KTGIVAVSSEKKSVEEYLGENESNFASQIKADLIANPKKIIDLHHDGEGVVIVNENGKIVAKRLVLEHKGESNSRVEFHLNEESDGTVRLLDYVPALRDVINR